MQIGAYQRVWYKYTYRSEATRRQMYMPRELRTIVIRSDIY